MILEESLHRVLLIKHIRLLILNVVKHLDKTGQRDPFDLLLVLVGLVSILFQVENDANVAETLINGLVIPIDDIVSQEAKLGSHRSLKLNMGNHLGTEALVVYNAAEGHPQAGILLRRRYKQKRIQDDIVG